MTGHKKQEYIIEVDKLKSHQHSNGYSRYGAYKKKPNIIYENDIVRQLQAQHMQKYGCNAYTSTLCASFTIYVKIPTQIKGRKLKALERKELEGKCANVKPDITNIIKTIEDCIERAGIIEDDVNITDYGFVKKRFNLVYNDKKEYVKIKLEDVV